MVLTGAEDHIRQPWHERTGSNGQRQGEKDHCNSSKAKTLQIKVLGFCARNFVRTTSLWILYHEIIKQRN